VGRSCLQPELQWAGAGRSARGARRRPMAGASTGWLGRAQAGERLTADLPAGRRAAAGRSRRLRCEWRGGSRAVERAAAAVGRCRQASGGGEPSRGAPCVKG
jgi:hypothetical protein